MNKPLFPDALISLWRKLMASQKKSAAPDPAPSRESQYPVAIEEIAGEIAHAIRNPLNAIELHTSLLQRRTSGPEQTEESLRIIHEETQRINRFVSLLVRFSHPWDPLLSVLRVGEVIDGNIARLTGAINARGLQVTLAHTEPGATLVADPDRIADLMEILLHNAIDASAKDGELKVTTRVERQQLLLTVSDSGKGIEPENLDRLFTPFFTTKTLGTGLGMCMVKKIISGHGGGIDIQSSPGKGTTVTVRLPLTQPMGETRLANGVHEGHSSIR